MAAKGKYTAKLVTEICDYIIEGNTVESICESLDISHQTFYRWKKEKSEFSEAIKKAEELRKDFGKALAVSSIFKAMANGVWQAGAWWLERNYPSEFKNVQEVTQTVDIKKVREELANHIYAKIGTGNTGDKRAA